MLIKAFGQDNVQGFFVSPQKQKFAIHKTCISANNKNRAEEKNALRYANIEKFMNFKIDQENIKIMSNNSNKVLVPEAKEALRKFKMEAANEVGVNLKEGYNGELTSKQAGSVGGQMVKKMIESYEQGMK